MRRLIKIAAFTLAALLPFQTYAANTSSIDYSDLWWNPDESGWGVNIANQGQVIFMTLFVYGADQKVKWYVASGLTPQGGSDPVAYNGAMYETTGPYLGGPFYPDAVSRRFVGFATITFPTGNLGLLSYEVDGILVNKRIERQTFRSNNLTGNYLGAMVGERTNCLTESASFADATQFLFSHAGAEIQAVTFVNNVQSCSYLGKYSQEGRMGSIEATISCQDGHRGTFRAFEIEAGQVGFTGRYRANYEDGCIEAGRIGGVR